MLIPVSYHCHQGGYWAIGKLCDTLPGVGKHSLRSGKPSGSRFSTPMGRLGGFSDSWTSRNHLGVSEEQNWGAHRLGTLAQGWVGGGRWKQNSSLEQQR